MMRYQRLSPDCIPISNGTKPSLRTCKKEDSDSGRISNCDGGFEGKPRRLRPQSTTSQDHNFSQFLVSDSLQSENHIVVKQENGSGGDILLQWGQKKRSRGSRAENHRVVVTDDSSALAKQMVKIQRRVVSGIEKKASNQAAMSPPCTTSRSLNHRLPTPVRVAAGSLLSRSLEERSVSGSGPQMSNVNGRAHSRSADKRSPRSPEKMNKMTSCSPTAAAVDEKPKGLLTVQAEPSMALESVPLSKPEACVTAEKMNLNLFEWPRIYIALSRKEKEDDFYAMKGTKLPQRPKKRAKNVDKILQYCFPGMWLSDLTKSRYEVREKKCVKKRRTGLKGMESMDSDSE